MLDDLGIERARLHDARHSCATLMHLRRVPIAVIASWLGHASAAFTMSVYAHSQDDALRAAAGSFGRVMTTRDTETGSGTHNAERRNRVYQRKHRTPSRTRTDTGRILSSFYSAFVPSSCVDRTTKGLVTALDVVVGSSCRKFCCGLAADWLRTKVGLIHQALASLHHTGPRAARTSERGRSARAPLIRPPAQSWLTSAVD